MAQEIADSTLLDTWGSGGNIVEPDISKIIEGWQLGEQPPHEYMNWLQNTFGSKLNHILKNGVATWNNTTQYLAGSSVQHNGNVWLCKTTNTNSEPTDANANWKRILTVESLTTVFSGYVATTGNQTIAGVKTFSSNPISSATQSTAVNALTRKDYVDSKVAKVASSDNAIVRFNGTTGEVQDSLIVLDDDGRIIKSGDFVLHNSDLNNASTSGETVLNLSYDTRNGSKIKSKKISINTTNLEFYVGYGYTSDKHVATLDHSGNLTLTQTGGKFIGDVDGNAATVTNGVYTTGNQTIAGVKTFSSSPIVPTPTTGTQAVNKNYVDSKAVGIGVGQTWQDVTGSRAAGTTYTNTTGRTIHVLISSNTNTPTTFVINGVYINVLDGNDGISIISAPIPSGGTYRLSAQTNTGSFKWLELR